MPTKKALLDRLKYEVEVKGKGEENVFYEDVEQRQKERAARGCKQERFILVTDDPELCARLNASKDRIFKRVGRHKGMMLTLIEKALAEALSDGEIDRILAAQEVIEARNS